MIFCSQSGGTKDLRLKSRKRNNRFSFQVSVNGTLFIKFKHRMRPEDITHLRLYGDIEPQKLEYRSKSIIIPPRGSLNVSCVNHIDRKCLVLIFLTSINKKNLFFFMTRPGHDVKQTFVTILRHFFFFHIFLSFVTFPLRKWHLKEDETKTEMGSLGSQIYLLISNFFFQTTMWNW